MQSYSQDLRERVLWALGRGERPTAIARHLEVSRVWVYQVRDREQKTGKRTSFQIGGHRRSRVAEMESVLRVWIEAEPDVALSELSERLAKQEVLIKPGANAFSVSPASIANGRSFQSPLLSVSSRGAPASAASRPAVSPPAPGSTSPTAAVVPSFSTSRRLLTLTRASLTHPSHPRICSVGARSRFPPDARPPRRFAAPFHLTNSVCRE